MVTFILRTAQERMRSMKEQRTKNPLCGRTGHLATARCRGLLRWTLSGEKQPVNAGTYVEGSSLRGKPITNLERRREVDAGHGKPHPQVWGGVFRPFSTPASEAGPAFARADDQMARW